MRTCLNLIDRAEAARVQHSIGDKHDISLFRSIPHWPQLGNIKAELKSVIRWAYTCPGSLALVISAKSKHVADFFFFFFSFYTFRASLVSLVFAPQARS